MALNPQATPCRAPGTDRRLDPRISGVDAPDAVRAQDRRARRARGRLVARVLRALRARPPDPRRRAGSADGGPGRRTCRRSSPSARRPARCARGSRRKRRCWRGSAGRSRNAIRRTAPGAVVFGAGAPRLPNTILFAVPGLKAETALIAFDLGGVALSSGSACSSGKGGTLATFSTRMGVDPGLAGGGASPLLRLRDA